MNASYIRKVPYVINDALQDRRECDHGVCPSAMDGLMRTLRERQRDSITIDDGIEMLPCADYSFRVYKNL